MPDPTSPYLSKPLRSEPEAMADVATSTAEMLRDGLMESLRFAAESSSAAYRSGRTDLAAELSKRIIAMVERGDSASAGLSAVIEILNRELSR